MNVLPPPAAPSAATSPRTGATSDGATSDVPAGFARLLADHVGAEHGQPGQAGTDGAATAGEPDDADAGAVEAAVHAALAAWQADPRDDVAVGTHLQRVQQGVAEHATIPVVPDEASTAVETSGVAEAPAGGAAPVPAEAPVVHGAARVEGAEGTGAPRTATTVTATAAPADDVVVATASVGGTEVEGPAARTGPVHAPVDAPVDAATTQPSTSPVAPSGTVDADGGGEQARRVAGQPAAARPRTVETGQSTDPVPGTTDHAGEPAEVPPTGRTETTGPTGRAPGTSPTTSAATLDRVMRAVEALEHAPPPRRLSLDVEGVQLTVAMQGEEVTVAIRNGADALAPGWQRDLAAALRGRGLDLAADTGPGGRSGQGSDAREDRPRDPAPQPARPTTSHTRSTPAADSAGLRL